MTDLVVFLADRATGNDDDEFPLVGYGGGNSRTISVPLSSSSSCLEYRPLLRRSPFLFEERWPKKRVVILFVLVVVSRSVSSKYVVVFAVTMIVACEFLICDVKKPISFTARTKRSQRRRKEEKTKKML